MTKDNKTIDYYDQNAQSFVENTINVDFKDFQDDFLSWLPKAGAILDFGCGSGRDTKYFLEKGYRVTAIDGSAVLCRMASEFTGIEVKQMMFDELNEQEAYDGIWACSSLLHVPADELKDVLLKMAAALKDFGIAYISFKYGEYEGERGGRFFLDMTENSFRELLAEIPAFKIEQQKITTDTRPDRDEKWLNLVLRKV